MKFPKYPPASDVRRLFFLSMALCFFAIAKSQTDFSKIDDWMDANAKNLGGRVILVVSQNDKVVYVKSVNDMSRRQKSINKYVAKKQNLEPDLNDYSVSSRQMIASCSKWLSAALVMTFIDEGKLRLTDTVGQYLPVLTVHGKGNITIGDCLSHLTGVKAPPLKESLKEFKNINNMDESIEKIAELPMEGSPGKVFHYSSVGLQIAAAVIEKISGQSFEALFSCRLAKPLDMKNTDFGYRKVPLPAGSAVSTPEDYINFLTMIINKGEFRGKRILSMESINEMQENRISPEVRIAYTPEEAAGLGYGYGEWVFKNPSGSETGNWVTSPGLFGSFPWINNEKHYGAFLMCFYLNNKGRADRYRTLKSLVDEAFAAN
jgi:CubicO group peptidase (beta-lactamase class C family)